MKSGLVRAWLAYAGVGMALVVVLTIVAAGLVAPALRPAILIGGAIAYVLQLAAFGLLLALRDKPQLFLAGWLGGMVLRFGALGAVLYWSSRTAVLYWSSRTAVLASKPLALSLVGFVFLLLLLEPVFLRWDLRRS